MTGFFENQVHRPLFEEPTDDIERADAWEEPLGFLVGGMKPRHDLLDIYLSYTLD